MSKTKPESWQVHFKPKQAELIETAKSFDSSGILMCLLAKDDEAQNLKDFLRLLESLINSTLSGGAIFIIRGNEELTSPVDTALQQWYGANRPTIRVQILDEEKLIAQELLARHPLCYQPRRDFSLSHRRRRLKRAVDYSRGFMAHDLRAEI